MTIEHDSRDPLKRLNALEELCWKLGGRIDQLGVLINELETKYATHPPGLPAGRTNIPVDVSDIRPSCTLPGK
jgi:hypothetical protein